MGTQWRRQETKRKLTTERWKNTSNLTGKEKVILTCLRIEHTRHIHGYLMKKEEQADQMHNL